jgi:hypothetical protein
VLRLHNLALLGGYSPPYPHATPQTRGGTVAKTLLLETRSLSQPFDVFLGTPSLNRTRAILPLGLSVFVSLSPPLRAKSKQKKHAFLLFFSMGDTISANGIFWVISS